jgi:lipopolysaccharide export system protein LptA
VDTTQSKLIEVIGADHQYFRELDDSTKIMSLAGHAVVKQGSTKFYADSIMLMPRLNMLEAFGNVHINDADTINTYSQYLKYLGKEKKGYLSKKVKLTDGKGILTTDSLVYDVQLKIGTYINGGKLVRGKTTLTSIEGYYYGDTKDVYFKRNVVLIDPQYKIVTDTLLYNTFSETTTFVAPTKIYNEKRIISTREGYYNINSGKGEFAQRPIIDDSTYTFTADKAAIDDKNGLSEYDGNAVYRSKDSLGQDLIANNIKINRITNSILATQKPILFLKQPGDTIYVSADTLYSAKLTQLLKSRNVPLVRDTGMLTSAALEHIDSNNNRFFEAYFHVKIFSDSLQAVGDSMFYSLHDSTFRLFKNPVVWAQSNQITGDTIYLFTQNRKPQRLYVFENAMAIQKLSDKYFNQVRGTTMNGFFKEGKIDSLRTKGSPSEMVYYGMDEHNKFFGVNKSSSDVISENLLMDS